MGESRSSRICWDTHSPMSHHPSYTFGGLLIVGGAIGYAKKGSVASGIAGLGLGAGLIAAGYAIQQGNYTKGHAASLVLSGSAVAAMLPNAIKRKPMPLAVCTV